MNDFLRTTFREHEHLVEDTPDLLPGVRRLVGRSRRVRLTAVLAVAAVTSSGAVLAHRTEVTTRPTVAKPPPGWRFESSLGAQIIVPENWSANRTACGQPLGPTVLRGHFATTACGTAFRLTPVAALVQARLPGSSGHSTQWARGRFSSAILPAWCRKSPQVIEVLPLLYLHGLSRSSPGLRHNLAPKASCHGSEGHPETGAMFLRLHGDGSAVGLGDLADDRESQSGARLGPARR